MPNNSLVVDDFQFGQTTAQDNVFTGQMDALVGLAYPSMAEEGIVPFFDQIMNTEQIERNVFAFHFSHNPDEEASELTIGYYDEHRFVPDTLKWHDVAHPVFWALDLMDIRLGGVSLGICGPDSVLQK